LTLFKTRKGDDPAAARLLAWLQKNEYSLLTGVMIENVIRFERAAITPEELLSLQQIFCHPMAENLTVTTALDESQGPVVEVSYQRAWTDPELPSIMHAAKSLGVASLEWARLAKRYQFEGVDYATAEAIVKRLLMNAQSQVIVKSGEAWTTLKPRGDRQPVELIKVAGLNDKGLIALSNERRMFLSLEQMQAIQNFYQQIERPAMDAELEMITAAWSDHCSHTTWRALGLLQSLQQATAEINHPLVVSAFIDNSGVMRFYGGWALNDKGETHISPTFVDTYGGIMTKHGGVIRDPMMTGQGAWPFAGTTIIATLDPRMLKELVVKGALHPIITVNESIRGTYDYTNPMGIPMACSRYLIHPRNVKSFALGHSIGILPEDRAQKGVPVAGDYIMVFGGKTGRDGIHGATVSSGAATAETAVIDAAHVQIGMPIEERKFMEAIPVLRDNDCVRAITDCGAAGLSSAVGELGAKVKLLDQILSGVWVNLAWVPLKCAGIATWEIWISESQERGVFAVPQEKLALALKILSNYDVSADVIGVFTASERCQVIWDPDINREEWLENPTTDLTGEIAIDLPYTFLTQDCPLPTIEVLERTEKPQPFMPPLPQNEAEWIKLVASILGHYNMSDQSSVAHRYDQTVQGATILSYIGGKDDNMPDELFAATPVLGEPWTAGIANAVNQYYGEVDPAGMARLIYAQAICKLVAAGFNPKDITTNVNVYTPKVTSDPHNAWDLVQLVKHGYAPASVQLGVPVISGKDSSSGTYVGEDGIPIHAPLTIDVLALGRMPDYQRLIPKAFAQSGDTLVLFYPGIRRLALGGSILFDLYGQRGDQLPKVDLKELKTGLLTYHRLLESLNWSKHAHSRSVVAEGGLIQRLFEMSLGNGLGCKVSLPSDNILTWLCSEFNTAILLATDRPELIPRGIDRIVIGEVIAEPLISVTTEKGPLFQATTAELSTQWLRTFREVVA
jgi:phosphoribosylformylglycinamidine synthase